MAIVSAPGAPEVFEFEGLKFLRDRNPDGLVPTMVAGDEPGYLAVRLSVKSGSYDGPLHDPDDNRNDRCELRGDKMCFPTDIWYGFAISVPDEFPAVPQRCVVAQIKCPFGATTDPSPVFSLRIDNRRWLATAEHMYEPQDAAENRYLTAQTSPGYCAAPAMLAQSHASFAPGAPIVEQVRAMLATDGRDLPQHLHQPGRYDLCTTGVRLETSGKLPTVSAQWIDFIVHFNPSPPDGEGLLELYCDNRLSVRAFGRFGKADAEGNGLYFKIGPYRNNVPNTPNGDPTQWPFEQEAALHVGHLRHGNSFESVRRKIGQPLLA